MNIVVLTADEPLYLPAFFQRFLQARGRETRAVISVLPRTGHGSVLLTLRRYVRAFGTRNLATLVRRLAHAKLSDRLGWGQSRGRYFSIASVCRVMDVHFERVADVNTPQFLDHLRSWNTDLVVSISCPQVFRAPLIALPRLGCLNVHGAPLPRYRGIAPSFWMMAKGESSAGATVHFVNEKIDAGDVVVRRDFPILPDETLDEFIVRSKRIHCDAMLEAIERVEQGGFTPLPLDQGGGTYFGFPTRAAYREFRRRGRRLW